MRPDRRGPAPDGLKRTVGGAALPRPGRRGALARVREAMTPRSGRALALLAVSAAFRAYVFVFCLVLTVTGRPPGYSFGRMVGMVLFLAVVSAASPRSSVVIRDAAST
ncbi:hypothetical protein SAMN04489713_109226 [Actinomadura madurae]|uniref:Uncharacterized protein n=1 Tax=Actinomadura madurae TaxID=1993 RepID=A0A1I5JWN2_9ACTN|nr:hypothetical protein SAMN04489713_109226 [Actinomadura madurae]